jgi:hypothetical protein
MHLALDHLLAVGGKDAAQVGQRKIPTMLSDQTADSETSAPVAQISRSHDYMRRSKGVLAPNSTADSRANKIPVRVMQRSYHVRPPSLTRPWASAILKAQGPTAIAP